MTIDEFAWIPQHDKILAQRDAGGIIVLLIERGGEIWQVRNITNAAADHSISVWDHDLDGVNATNVKKNLPRPTHIAFVRGDNVGYVLVTRWKALATRTKQKKYDLQHYIPERSGIWMRCKLRDLNYK